MTSGIYKRTELARKHMSENRKGYHPKSEFKKGYHPKSEFKKSHIVTNETRKKISLGNKGKVISEDVKIKLSLINKNKILSLKTKEKLRQAAFKYAIQINNIICPRVGRNEKKLLDAFEKNIGYKITRQYKVSGYFLDGYIPELNLAIEIDERPKTNERDIERQKIIENKLNCKFIRINDYDN